MNNEGLMYTMLCKRCYKKIYNPAKHELKKVKFEEEKDYCECCGELEKLIDTRKVCNNG